MTSADVSLATASDTTADVIAAYVRVKLDRKKSLSWLFEMLAAIPAAAKQTEHRICQK